MNHHSKICDHGLANDLAVSTLLLLIKHYQKKRKVVTQTGCWNNLLQTKRRYNSWWSKIKLLCKMNWKRTSKWPYFLPGGSTKWYFFPTILYQCRTLVNCWGKLCKTQKLKKMLCFDILQMWWIVMLVQKNNLFSKFPYSCLVLRYENFLNNFFLCLNKVTYMTKFVGIMTVWGFIL